MTRSNFALIGAAGLAAFASTALAEIDVDGLTETRMQQTQMIFDQVLDRPTTQVDAVSQVQWSMMRASYDVTGRLDVDSDVLPQSRLSAMYSAYDSLDRTSDLPAQ